MIRTISGAICALGLSLSATGVFAQESSNRVAANTDWSVFVEDNPKECWSVSSPKETVNTKNGRSVAVKRGNILLFVSYRPGAEVKGEVSFTGGYPFAPGSTVSLTVGDSTFQMFTDGEWAWSASPGDDAKIITAMKRGASAVANAQSARGTKTQDTFSLLGFTAAVEEAGKRCGG
ncbi:invasion associated locus B family protein [Aliiroseovarius sp. S1339]|uniref:invasion associated locus B family protein n=1 Tax=Aliiroseovarius sp. S1339 TaxID=2936990 RepID=UPI0020C171E1|nr:invasion associated locus B family protein [Aliiroseovarius sp. S1339]MCK8465316.1 invasion associated locus B family protein [Aliiroseovarius sp. S1339]